MSIDSKNTYYDAGGIETIDIIKAELTPERYEGYLPGSIVKYRSRMMHKDCKSPLKEADKIATYTEWLAEALEKKLGVEITNNAVNKTNNFHKFNL